jgi:hypothetical protein
VRPYSKGQKNDFRDAEAIAEAVQRPTMKFVAIKTVAEKPHHFATKSRSPLPMQGRSAAKAASVDRSPESWIVCLIKLCVAIEPRRPRL